MKNVAIGLIVFILMPIWFPISIVVAIWFMCRDIGELLSNWYLYYKKDKK